MSMPEFPRREDILSRDDAINAILTSIATEEAALSHIINAEGEKLQYALAQCADLDKIVDVNKSISSVLETITDLQFILKNKMRIAEKFLAEPAKKCCCKCSCCSCSNCCSNNNSCNSNSSCSSYTTLLPNIPL